MIINKYIKYSLKIGVRKVEKNEKSASTISLETFIY